MSKFQLCFAPELGFSSVKFRDIILTHRRPMVLQNHGISNTDKDLDKEERKRVIDRIINGKKVKYEQWNGDEKKRQKQVQRREKLRKKIEIAMKKKPIARDWKIIRNGFKFLIKDIFN